MTQLETTRHQGDDPDLPPNGGGASGPTAAGGSPAGSGPLLEPVSRLAWFTLAISSTAAFMVAMEVTVISLALPRIQGAFPGTSESTLSWVFSAYSIGVASLLLVAGWAADLYGRKRLFLIGMTIFGGGSLLSGAAQSMAWLIGARALQSVGGAMLFPSGLALVLAIFPPSRRQLAIGIWAAMGGLAGAVGPSAGALLIQWLGWRAVFLFNVPVAAVAVPLGLRGLVESKAEGVARRVDVIGVPLASLGVGALVLAIVEGSDWGWGSVRVVGLLVLSVVMVAGFVLRSLRHPAPLFDLDLLRIRSYGVGLLGSLLFAAGFFGSWVLLPTFIQAEWHWGVVKTGLAFMPASLISAVLSGPIGSRVDRFGHRRVVALGGLLAAAGMAAFALFMSTTPRILTAVVLPTVLLGLGMAVLFAMIVGAAMRDVPMARYGSAGAGRTTIFQMGQALGVAVGVAVIGRPQGPAAALNAYRHNWIISAAMLGLVVVLFLVAYPSHRPRLATAAAPPPPPPPLDDEAPATAAVALAPDAPAADEPLAVGLDDEAPATAAVALGGGEASVDLVGDLVAAEVASSEVALDGAAGAVAAPDISVGEGAGAAALEGYEPALAGNARTNGGPTAPAPSPWVTGDEAPTADRAGATPTAGGADLRSPGLSLVVPDDEPDEPARWRTWALVSAGGLASVLAAGLLRRLLARRGPGA